MYANDDRILAYNGEVITHDSSGARTTEVRGADTLRFQYDDLGRLSETASKATGALAFRLDAQGRRIQELRNGIVVRGFLYGTSAGPIGELTATGTLRTEFVYVSGELAPDYMIQGTKTYYLLHDHLGSVRQAIDVATGAEAQAIDYDVDGNIIRNTNPGFQPFGYAGGMTDLDGRTVHFGARDYDPRTGRWLQPDPVGMAGGQNRYQYAAGDPVNHIDPDGTIVVFRGENDGAALRAAWGRLKRLMRNSKRGTGKLLYERMIEMELSSALYIIQEDNSLGARGQTGPAEGPGAWRTIFLNLLAIASGGGTIEETLAHELGHLVYRNSPIGILQPSRAASNIFANDFQNAYRCMVGLPPVEVHTSGSEW
jgi:RHS repeat-associated protein